MQLLLDAGVQQMCKYDLSSFLSRQAYFNSKLPDAALREMAKRIYFDKNSTLKARKKGQDNDSTEFKPLYEAVWDMRVEMHQGHQRYLQEYAARRSDIEDDDADNIQQFSSVLELLQDQWVDEQIREECCRLPRLFEALEGQQALDFVNQTPYAIFDRPYNANDTYFATWASLRPNLGLDSVLDMADSVIQLTAIEHGSRGSRRLNQWITEFFLMQACIFHISTDETGTHSSYSQDFCSPLANYCDMEGQVCMRITSCQPVLGTELIRAWSEVSLQVQVEEDVVIDQDRLVTTCSFNSFGVEVCLDSEWPICRCRFCKEKRSSSSSSR